MIFSYFQHYLTRRRIYLKSFRLVNDLTNYISSEKLDVLIIYVVIDIIA